MSVIRKLSGSLLATPVTGRVLLAPVARWGYRNYRRTGETPRAGFVAMRKLYAADPVAFDRLVRRAQGERQPLALPDAPSGIIAGHVDEAVEVLERDGLFVLPDRLPEPVCVELTELATRAECTLVGEHVARGRRGRFSAAAPEAPRYEIEEHDLLMAPVVQRLLADQSVLAVAQRYLGSAPVQDLVAMWWSAAVPQAPSSIAAQMFHFDLDRLRFLKLFVYLTDVEADTGPHVFVRGTHAHLAREFRADRRYADRDVSQAYGEAIATITGHRGTVFMADTRALHKGQAVAHGHRLVFQMEYASSLFGQTYTRGALDGHIVADLEHAIAMYPSVFERFRRSGVSV
jgi:hypothetical protein